MMFLEISKVADAEFAFVVMIYGAIALLALCLITGVIEWIGECKERCKRLKRNRNRQGYVRIEPDRRYR